MDSRKVSGFLGVYRTRPYDVEWTNIYDLIPRPPFVKIPPYYMVSFLCTLNISFLG